MENQSGFPKRRTDLSAKLRVMSKSPETSQENKWQKRYDARYLPQNYKLRAIQRNPRDKRKYSNI